MISPSASAGTVLTVAALGLALAHPVSAQQTVRLPAADQPLAAAVSTVFAADGAGGQDRFADVASVGFDREGRLFVLDRGQARVAVFDAAGRPVRQFGRRGRGTGEFVAPAQMAVTQAGEVVVADLGRRAWMVFGVDGAFRRTVPFTGDGAPGLSLQPHPTRGVVAVVRPVTVTGPVSQGGESSLSVVWFPLGGDAPEVRLFRTTQEVVRRSNDEGSRESRVVTATAPTFAPGLLWAPLPAGGLAVSHTAEYRVQVVGRDGRVVRTVERPLRPRAVTAADREWARERKRRTLTSGRGVTVINYGGGGASADAGVPREVVDQQVEEMAFAATVPVIQRVAADGKGRLWVGRSGARAGSDGPVDLVTQEGRYLGTIRGLAVPDAFGPAGRTATIERSATGASRVVVRALPASLR